MVKNSVLGDRSVKLGKEGTMGECAPGPGERGEEKEDGNLPQGQKGNYCDLFTERISAACFIRGLETLYSNEEKKGQGSGSLPGRCHSSELGQAVAQHPGYQVTVEREHKERRTSGMKTGTAKVRTLRLEGMSTNPRSPPSGTGKKTKKRSSGTLLCGKKGGGKRTKCLLANKGGQ